MNNLGNLLCVERRYSEAEQLLLEARATELRNLGPKAPETAATTYNLACLSALRGKRDQSLGLLQEAVDNGLPARVLRLIATDPDLNSLHDDHRFGEIVKHAVTQAGLSPSEVKEVAEKQAVSGTEHVPR